MLKLKLMPILKTSVVMSVLAFFTLLLTACETKVEFLKSAVVPAAQGYAKIKTDNNKNFKIYVSVKGLAESTRLTPSKSTYVVWIVGENNNVQNIGQIQTSKMSGSLETVSPFKPTKLFITAEDGSSVQFPGLTILTTATFK